MRLASSARYSSAANESSKARLHSTLWSQINSNAMVTKDLHRAIEFFVVNDLKRDVMKPRIIAYQFQDVMVATGRAQVQMPWRLVDNLKPAGIHIETSLAGEVANTECQM
jgi:hypothetical protein